MKIVLLANYLPDQQESMQRYVAMLEKLLRVEGHEVEILRPRAILGRLKPSAHGLGKWLGYVDKFILFRFALGRRIRALQREDQPFLVHVCDHSNSMYVPWLGCAHLVTCHDLLAIKSARGLVPGQRTGWTGRILQQWILNGISRAQFVACDSAATRDDLVALLPHLAAQSEVIELPLSYPFAALLPTESRVILDTLGDGRLVENARTVPYLFHVGGNQWYKNREGVLQVFVLLKKSGDWPALKLVMAGKMPSEAMERIVRENALGADIFFPPSVSDLQLNALYSAAQALVYPSLQEGYGWPILEAQASDCLVVTSDRPPMNLLGGPATRYADPADPVAFAEVVADLLRDEPVVQAKKREQGRAHAASYRVELFLEKMSALYRRLTTDRLS